MIKRIYKTRKGSDPYADRVKSRLTRAYPELQGLRVECVLRLELQSNRNIPQYRDLFTNQLIEMSGYQSLLSDQDGPIVEIAYKRAFTDPEMYSIRHAAEGMGLRNLVWARLSHRYQFLGLTNEQALEAALRFLCNPQVQTIIQEGEEWDTLVPQGQIGEVELLDLRYMDGQELIALSKNRRLGLSLEEMSAIQEFCCRENRLITDGELEGISGRWSDHCYHTSWKRLGLLKLLQETTLGMNHPLVRSAFVDNAGAMEFYDGWVITIKGETHISPTFAGDPYGGIMTKHGGVQRDIMFVAEGGYPFFGSTVMGTVEPRLPWTQLLEGATHPRQVVLESIRGTADYCNAMGIPNGESVYFSHSRYWKGFALGHCAGIMPEGRVFKRDPYPGDFVVLIGGETGLDGIHGATVSSGAATTKTSTADVAHVQIGHPITQRPIMEVVPVLRDAGCIRVGNDCGAAGLMSAVGELGEHTGVLVNLAFAPLKCRAMRPWQIKMSESQERGILAVPPDKLTEALKLLDDYGVPASVIGEFTDTHRFQAVYNQDLSFLTSQFDPTAPLAGQVVSDLPYDFLNNGCPLPPLEIKEPAIHPSSFTRPPVPDSEEAWRELIVRHLGHYDICDQSAAAHQFDQTVQGRTVSSHMVGRNDNVHNELALYAPILGKCYGVGFANAVNQRYGELNPGRLGELVTIQAITRLVAAGFNPDEITLCANVYTPRVVGYPENAWRLDQLVRYGYCPTSKILNSPVITGKDSSSGTFTVLETGEDIHAPLTLDILATGRIKDVRRVIPKAFQKARDMIILYTPGLIMRALGGSVFLDLFGQLGKGLPQYDLDKLKQGHRQFWDMNMTLQNVTARSTVAEGGTIRRLFEMGEASGFGCTITVDSPFLDLFAELHGGILFTTRDQQFLNWLDRDDCRLIGVVTEEPYLRVDAGRLLFSASLQDLGQQWRSTFTEVVV